MFYCLTLKPSILCEKSLVEYQEFEFDTDSGAIQHAENPPKPWRITMPNGHIVSGTPKQLERWGEYEDSPTLVKQW